MAGVHPDRLGLDHRAQLQAAKVHEQLADRLTDVLMGVKIRSNATQIEHVTGPWMGLI